MFLADNLSVSRKWLVLIAMVGGQAVIFLDQTIIGVAVPTIQRYFEGTELEMQWVINTYLLAMAVLVVPVGRLGDMFGYSRIYVWGISLFGAASLLAGTASSLTVLLLARIFQGFGAAMVWTNLSALIFSVFKEKERGHAMGVFVGISGICLALGPLAGGLFIGLLSWRWIFYINVPLSIVVLVLSIFALPRDKGHLRHEKFDFFGAASLFIGLFALVLALMQGKLWGWSSFSIISLFVLSVACLLIFRFYGGSRPNPLVDFSLFRNKIFLGGNIALFCVQFAVVVPLVFWAIWLQDHGGYSPMVSGIVLLGATIPQVFLAPLMGYLYRHFSARWLSALGCLLILVGALWVEFFDKVVDYWQVLPGFISFGIGVPLAFIPLYMAMLASISNDKRGTASGVFLAVRHVGGSIGMALVGAIFVNVKYHFEMKQICDHPAYASAVEHLLILNQLEGVLVGSPIARKILQYMPEDTSSWVVDMVHHAFSGAFAGGMLVTAGVAFIGLVFAWWSMPKAVIKN